MSSAGIAMAMFAFGMAFGFAIGWRARRRWIDAGKQHGGTR